MCLFLPHLLNSSLSDLSSVWDPIQVRNTISMPVSPTRPATETKQRRKTTQPVHKANTIGIPSAADLASASDIKTQTTNKTRLNLFGGFRHTLKSKHKTDPVSTEHTSDAENSQRNWTEPNQTVIIYVNTKNIYK